MNCLGIMQGRLLPPVNGKIQAFPGANWEEEFRLAANLSLDCIEWIYDGAGEGVNPLTTETGIARMHEAIARYGVAVHSVCADYFMEKPLVRASVGETNERLARLEWLIGQCRLVGITRVVLPFVDQSSITTHCEEKRAAESLQSVLSIAERSGVELHVETSLSPDACKRFLALVSHPFLKVNYDSGNSASLGYDPREEFKAYGKLISSVHIKDRKRGGGSVPLGSGDTDFSSVFPGLRSLGYAGDFILQAARGTRGEELGWAKENLLFVKRHLS